MADTVERSTPRPDQLVSLALDRAYLAFGGHRVGATMPVRRNDVTSEEVSALAAPVRTVTAEAIDRWLPHAITTWGSASDLRALLPRVLELFAEGRLETAPETVFTKVRWAEPPTWSMEEQAAVDDVVAAVWLATLSAWPARAGHPAWRVLMAAVELGSELSAFLDDWLLVLGTGSPEHSPARRHLQDLDAKVSSVEARGGTIGELFWTSNPVEAARLETWLRSPLTRNLL
jgi:hypothetical protein